MNRDPPEVSKPLGYGTIRVALLGCATPLPPVRESSECGALEIGKSIDTGDVCDLLESLKKWITSRPADAPSVHPGDWTQVRAVCVSRFWRAPPISEQLPIPPPPPRSGLRLEADLPNRSLRMGVQTSDHRGLEYYVTPR